MGSLSVMDELQPHTSWTSDKPESQPKRFPFLTKLVEIGRFTIWWQPGSAKHWMFYSPKASIGIDWEVQLGPLVFRWVASDYDRCKDEGHKPVYFVSEERARKQGNNLEDWYSCRCRRVQYFGYDTLEDAIRHWEENSIPTVVIESIEYLGSKK